MESLQIFCRQIRDRSKEHRKAFQLLYPQGLISQVVAILRQELDSMVRVIYLLRIEDRKYRKQLIDQSVKGERWRIKTAKGKRRNITDRDLIDLANQLQGWAENVYRFGCAFIHLSKFHDYKNRDPLKDLDDDEKSDIKRYLESYHGASLDELGDFSDIVPYLHEVFKKISSNLESYLDELEADSYITERGYSGELDSFTRNQK